MESILRVAREPIAARDQIAIERVLQAFHEEGRNFRMNLPGNFDILWPRELFNPVWNSKPSYRTELNVGDGQTLTVEYWAPRGANEDAWPLLALAVSFLLAATSIAALWIHVRRWRADVTGIESYLLDPKAALDLNLFHFDFFHRLASQIREKESEREKRFESEKRSEKLREAAQQAAQVAHDIRSPLAALEVASADAAQLPEEKRVLIQGAVARIRDIANSLLDRQRSLSADASLLDAGGEPPPVSEAAAPQLLSSLIEPLVSEKRLQFRSRPRITIEARLDASSYGLFASVRPVEFKRLLSNLINNSVEALDRETGTVRVSLNARDGRARVCVRDDGRGIPPDVLARLGRRGETHAKAGGSGLGLHHARTAVESWNGRLELDSELGAGTSATVVLPLAPAPSWFVPELTLKAGQRVVILDDDTSIHQVWQGRLDALDARGAGVEVVHFSTPDEIRAWAGRGGSKPPDALYLFDHELQGYRETGLSLAEELGVCGTTVLVTSRGEEPEILDGCRRLRVRLIPKGLAGLVPISIAREAAASLPDGRWDAVLIDDDRLTRLTWTAAAKRSGKHLLSCATTEEFLAAAGGVDRRVPIYVDVELADGTRGESESRRLHELGFREIYLATGHPAAKFAGLSHLRGVIGKDPPWA